MQVVNPQYWDDRLVDLKKMLQTSTGIYQRSAIMALGNGGSHSESAIPLLIPFLSHQDRDFCLDATISVFKIDPEFPLLPGQIDRLLSFSDDTPYKLIGNLYDCAASRANQAHASYFSGDRTPLVPTWLYPRVVALLQHSDPKVRLMSIRMMLWCREFPETADHLIDVIRTHTTEECVQALNSLSFLRPWHSGITAHLLEMAKTANPTVVVGIIQTLGYLRPLPDEVVSFFAEILSVGAPPESLVAVLSANLGSSNLLGAVLPFLDDPNLTVQKAACEALLRFKSRSRIANDILLRLSDSKDQELARIAKETFDRINHPEADYLLRSF